MLRWRARRPIKSIGSYQADLRRLARSYWNGKISRSAFRQGLSKEIQGHYYQAWQWGIRGTGGSESEEGLSALQDAVAEDVGSISDLADFIDSGPSLSEMYDRLDLWVNRYDGIRDLARLYETPDNQLMIWEMGNTKESCKDCLDMAGQILTAAEWRDWRNMGIYPKSRDLDCHGYNCQCRLRPLTRAEAEAMGYTQGVSMKRGRKFDLFDWGTQDYGNPGWEQVYRGMPADVQAFIEQLAAYAAKGSGIDNPLYAAGQIDSEVLARWPNLDEDQVWDAVYGKVQDVWDTMTGGKSLRRNRKFVMDNDTYDAMGVIANQAFREWSSADPEENDAQLDLRITQKLLDAGYTEEQIQMFYDEMDYRSGANDDYIRGYDGGVYPKSLRSRKGYDDEDTYNETYGWSRDLVDKALIGWQPMDNGGYVQDYTGKQITLVPGGGWGLLDVEARGFSDSSFPTAMDALVAYSQGNLRKWKSLDNDEGEIWDDPAPPEDYEEGEYEGDIANAFPPEKSRKASSRDVTQETPTLDYDEYTFYNNHSYNLSFSWPEANEFHNVRLMITPNEPWEPQIYVSSTLKLRPPGNDSSGTFTDLDQALAFAVELIQYNEENKEDWSDFALWQQADGHNENTSWYTSPVIDGYTYTISQNTQYLDKAIFNALQSGGKVTVEEDYPGASIDVTVDWPGRPLPGPGGGPTTYDNQSFNDPHEAMNYAFEILAAMHNQTKSIRPRRARTVGLSEFLSRAGGEDKVRAYIRRYGSDSAEQFADEVLNLDSYLEVIGRDVEDWFNNQTDQILSQPRFSVRVKAVDFIEDYHGQFDEGDGQYHAVLQYPAGGIAQGIVYTIGNPQPNYEDARQLLQEAYNNYSLEGMELGLVSPDGRQLSFALDEPPEPNNEGPITQEQANEAILSFCAFYRQVSNSDEWPYPESMNLSMDTDGSTWIFHWYDEEITIENWDGIEPQIEDKVTSWKVAGQETTV